MKSSMFLLSVPALIAGSAQAQFTAHNAGHPARHAQPAIANPPPAPLVGGSDSCATPDVISGLGTFPFDDTTATTGTEGQTTINCIQYNLISIPNDVWFRWTAPQTGPAELSSCGQSIDTKIAIYTGSTCPGAGASALACADDSVNPNLPGAPVPPLWSQLFFNATAGQTYLIQVGTSPAQPPGVPGIGQFTINMVSDTCSYDDGSAEDSLGLTAGGELGWMVRMGSIGSTTNVSAVSTAWGDTGGAAIPAGQAATIVVWDDPNDDGDPTDGVVVSSVATTVQNPGTNLLQTINLPSTVTLNGVFFVGVITANIPNQFAVPMDETPSCGYRPGAFWIVGTPGGVVDINNLANNGIPPAALDQIDIGFGAITVTLLTEATCGSGGPVFVGTPFCPGDGSGTACPCGNSSAAGANEGCLSSLAVGGKLRGMGSISLANDTLQLQGSQMPNSSALYFQGTIQQSGGAGGLFGDGLRCAGGSVIRLGTLTNASGSSVYPSGSQQPVSVKGSVTAPGVRTYQCWYRNAAAFCTPSTFNLTNGLSITWTP